MNAEICEAMLEHLDNIQTAVRAVKSELKDLEKTKEDADRLHEVTSQLDTFSANIDAWVDVLDDKLDQLYEADEE